MKNFLMIGVGLLLGIAGMLIVDRSSSPSNSEGTHPKKFHSESRQSSHSSRVLTQDTTPPSTEKRRSLRNLRAEVLNYAVHDVASQINRELSDLTEEEAEALSQSLRALNDGIRDHERRNFQIEEQGKERAVIFIPALPENGIIFQKFESNLEETLGAEKADRLVGHLKHTLRQQFFWWGKGAQRITVEFGESEYRIRQGIIVGKGTFNYDWPWRTKTEETFPWLHEAIGHSPPASGL